MPNSKDAADGDKKDFDFRQLRRKKRRNKQDNDETKDWRKKN